MRFNFHKVKMKRKKFMVLKVRIMITLGGQGVVSGRGH